VKITVPFVSCYDQLLYLVSGLLILLTMIISGGPMWHLCYYQSHNKTMPDLVIQHEKKKDGKISDVSRKTIKASANMRLVTNMLKACPKNMKRS